MRGLATSSSADILGGATRLVHMLDLPLISSTLVRTQ